MVHVVELASHFVFGSDVSDDMADCCHHHGEGIFAARPGYFLLFVEDGIEGEFGISSWTHGLCLLQSFKAHLKLKTTGRVNILYAA